MKLSSFAMLIALVLSFYVAKKHLYHLAHDSTNGIAQILEQRHSGFSYDPKKQVTDAQIKMLIKAAQLTPSSFNEQPWNFIICNKATNLEAYNKTLSSLAEANRVWANNAPILVIIATSLNSHADNKPNLWAQFDTGAAAFSMAIQATSLGLMTHQMAGFSAEKIKRLFNLPQDVAPMSIMAIGYEYKNRSNFKPRERKPIDKNFFQGSWGSTNNDWN